MLWQPLYVRTNYPQQELQKHAKTVASRFTNETRSRYEDAAERLRLPYWDWAKATPSNVPILPRAFTDEEVEVTFPNSSSESIRNPLYEYRFHPLDNDQINGTGCSTLITADGPQGGDPDVCENSPMTIRRGKPNSDHPALDSALRDILESQRRTLFNILSQWQDFNTFSNDGSCSSGRVIGTLETLHNPIHTRNFPGHMSPVSVAAFDPMFWLHHA
jgi:tyrosinase